MAIGVQNARYRKISKRYKDNKIDNWNPKFKIQKKLAIGVQNAKYRKIRKLTIGIQNPKE